MVAQPLKINAVHTSMIKEIFFIVVFLIIIILD